MCEILLNRLMRSVVIFLIIGKSLIIHYNGVIVLVVLIVGIVYPCLKPLDVYVIVRMLNTPRVRSALE